MRNCPAPQTLRAFARGQLGGDEAAAVAAHLDVCDVCRQGTTAPSETSAPPTADSTPATGAPTGATTPHAPSLPGRPEGKSASLPGLPPELAEHPTYQVERELGRGGMGVVYLARNKMMDRVEVLKVMQDRLAGRDDLAQRFIKEIQLAARVQHPGIATAYSAFWAGGALVLAMEYVDGYTLAEVVKRKGPLPVAHACFYARLVALGLQRAHEEGLVHRDIKPANLMVSRRGEVKILDFGLAKVASEQGDSGLTGANAMMGTPDYMPPEQATDARSADIRADVYALGCTLFHLLAGRLPFSGRSSFEVMQAHQTQPPPPLATLRADVPAELAQLVTRMLAKRPEDRPQEPAEVARALLPFCKAPEKEAKREERTVPPLPRSPTPMPARPSLPPPPAPFGSTQLPRGRALPALPVPPAEREAHRPSVPAAPRRPRARPVPAWLVVGAVVTVLLVAVAAAVWFLKSPDGQGPEAKGGAKKERSEATEKGRGTDLGPPSGADKGDVASVPAPPGAKLLFDGKNLDGWVARDGDPAGWRLLAGGAMEARGGDIHTRERFGRRFRLHVEFRVPDERARPAGQGRGNSGVYLQGRYELQVLDSEGVAEPTDRDGGAIYGVAAPLVNACKPPLVWQSYDVEFTSPKEEPGGGSSPARMTVHHNGVKIHDDVAVTAASGRSLDGDLTAPGPILLQDHGSPVQFRNIWLLPLKD